MATSSLAAAAPAEDADAMSCVILPDEQVELGSPVPGVIENINVRRSDHVRAGQPIVTLESSVEQATVALAQARAATQTEIDLRRVEYGYDAQHRDRLHALQAREAVSPQHLEDASRVAEAAQLRVRLAQDRRREAVLDKKRADAMLALKTIVSPIDGVVLRLHNRVGEYVETRPVVSIARLDPLRIEVIAPLSMFGAVSEGMQVAIRPETDPDRERVATVTAVDAVADPGSGTFGIELALPNPDLNLPAGIKCTGRLLASQRDSQSEPDRRAAGTAAAAAAPAQAEPLPAQICLAFEPQHEEQQARRLVAAARSVGGQATIERVETPRVIGYVVVTPRHSPAKSLDTLVSRMQRAGLTDLAVMNRGEFAGRIALGAYNGPLSAERRRVELEALGFAAEVLPRTRASQAWQVRVRLRQHDQHDALVAQIEDHARVAVSEPQVCEQLLSDAR